MNSERRLKLVQPADAEATLRKPLRRDEYDRLEEELPSDLELSEADALKAALDEGGEPLAGLLRAAARPAELSEADHEALLARALGGSEGLTGADAPATAAEKREAQKLSKELSALDRGDARAGLASEGAELSAALRAAWSPRDISPLKNEALIASALRKASNGEKSGSGRLSLMMVTFTVAAAAAAALLFFGRSGLLRTPAEQSAAAPQTPVAAVARLDFMKARSTMELFDPATPFPEAGGTSERMDRIVGARSSDLRHNRFAAWGVR